MQSDLTKTGLTIPYKLLLAVLAFVAISALSHSLFSGSRLTNRINEIETARELTEKEVEQINKDLRTKITAYRAIIDNHQATILLIEQELADSRSLTGEIRDSLEYLRKEGKRLLEDLHQAEILDEPE